MSSRFSSSTSSATNDCSYTNPNLEKEISRCKAHSWVELSDQKLTDEDMDIIVQQAIINKQCVNLNLRYNRITSIGASILADAFKNNQTIQILYLSFNQIGDKGVKLLSNALANNTTLVELQLESNEITDSGLTDLSQMLKTNRTLNQIGLAANRIGDQGIKALAESLTHHNTHLQVLNVRENQLITDRSLDYFIDIIKHSPALNKLSVSHCGLSTTAIQRLRQITDQKHHFVLGAD
jgi:Ran GTPase-activating protein (RanGAP) involved in mRNA processing and transport